MASETHINAYYADVEEAKAQVILAESKLYSAESRLHEKMVALGLVKDETSTEEPDTEVQAQAKTKEETSKHKKTTKAKDSM